MAPVEIRKLAFFGCTGNTGSAVLKTLLAQAEKSTKIHLFVRSARKLKLLFPGIESYSYVEITEGQLSDHALMVHCLSGATHIMCTIGSNDNQPGMRMHRDAVEAILAALSELHGKAVAEETWRRPHMTFLSSESISEKLSSHRPAWVHWLIMASLNHIYFDLAMAEKKLVSSSLVSVTLFHAPFLFEGEYSGYTISIDEPAASASYGDLGAAMAEMAFLLGGSRRPGRCCGESYADGPRRHDSGANPEAHQWNSGSFHSWVLEPARMELSPFTSRVMKASLTEEIM